MRHSALDYASVEAARHGSSVLRPCHLVMGCLFIRLRGLSRWSGRYITEWRSLLLGKSPPATGRTRLRRLPISEDVAARLAAVRSIACMTPTDAWKRVCISMLEDESVSARMTRAGVSVADLKERVAGVA
jgi:hypothetical protein